MWNLFVYKSSSAARGGNDLSASLSSPLEATVNQTLSARVDTDILKAEIRNDAVAKAGSPINTAEVC